jgi:hypothetical protein
MTGNTSNRRTVDDNVGANSVRDPILDVSIPTARVD